MNANPAKVQRPSETREYRSRLIKCALVVEESRAYWEHVKPGQSGPDAQVAFEEYWFGAKSLDWVKVLLLNLRNRFNAFPEALEVLTNWGAMAPETRIAICHWHLQLTDPLYRAFSGELLFNRREALRPEINRKSVIDWIEEQVPGRWTLQSRKQLAKRLLSVGLAANIVSGRRDPRQLVFPRIPDEALAYLLHLLRGIDFEGSMTQNPYLRSIGLEGHRLEERLRSLPSLRYRRTADVIEFDWQYPNPAAWAAAELPQGGATQ